MLPNGNMRFGAISSSDPSACDAVVRGAADPR